MIVLGNTGGVAATNCFLVGDERTRECVLFDAPDHTVGPLLCEVEERGWNLIGLWLTHGHFDHFADHKLVKDRFPAAKVLIHRLDEAKAQRPDAQVRMFGLAFVIPPLTPDGYVEDKQRLAIGGIEVEVIHTPGHSPGHVGYYFPQERVLVGGDLIIAGSVGRTDLPDSNHADLESSIRRVMKLPAETRLVGGHGPETTLKSESIRNPFVQLALTGKLQT
jgi:glyoxylase-like metal-dependent hydrolase (beta-lactamase superfamily II)